MVVRSRTLVLCFALVVVSLIATCVTLRRSIGPGVREVLEIRPAGELVVADHRAKTRVRFAVLGDSGTGTPEQHAVGEVLHQHCAATGGCDFILVTGDNIYRSGAWSLEGPEAERALSAFEKQFEAPYRAFGRTDFWLVAGNHDWLRRGSIQSEISYSRLSERWRMPALDYAVPQLPEWLAIHAIDTTLLTRGLETGQMERARESLCAAPGWRLLFGHHPVYTPGGRHGRADGTFEEIEGALLDGLIRRCGVDVYFAGHDHLQGHLRTPDFDQIIQGAGGGDLYAVKRNGTFPPGSGVEVISATSAFGFAIVEVSPEELSFEFVEASAPAGRVIHQANLGRQPASR